MCRFLEEHLERANNEKRSRLDGSIGIEPSSFAALCEVDTALTFHRPVIPLFKDTSSIMSSKKGDLDSTFRRSAVLLKQFNRCVLPSGPKDKD